MPDATYIIHTQHPQFVGQLYKFQSLIDRNNFLNEQSEKDIIQVTPTTVLVVESYFQPSVSIKDKKYLENKVVHWVIANYLNSST